MTRNMLAAAGLAAVFTLAVAACGGEEETEPLDSLVFMAGFKAQANLPFVAAYVAQEKGFFREQGLNVKIRHSASGQHLQLLMSGDVDVTTAAATSVLKRRSDPELPIVAIALFGQRGQQAYVALEGSGIETLQDWEGKIFGYKVSPPPDYLAMLKANNVDRSKITEVNAGFDPRILTEGRVDVLAVFRSNEPNIIRGLGFKVTLWDPADQGVPSMGLTYITRQALADQDPGVVERFLKATLKGTQYILDNREEALDIVMKYAPQEQREHQRFMLDTELRDAVSPLTEEHGLGWMTAEQWQALYEQLLEFEALPRPFDFRTAYTDRFLKAVYTGNQLSWP
jgi:ABC-type nitrate/sulfonate/bicarbonate transport system substrate-binding protein